MTLMYKLDLDILKTYVYAENDVAGQGFEKLEHKQDRQTQTDRQMPLNVLPATFVGGNVL